MKLHRRTHKPLWMSFGLVSSRISFFLILIKWNCAHLFYSTRVDAELTLQLKFKNQSKITTTRNAHTRKITRTQSCIKVYFLKRTAHTQHTPSESRKRQQNNAVKSARIHYFIYANNVSFIICSKQKTNIVINEHNY